MISYHPKKTGDAWVFARDFKVANTSDVERIARGISSHVWSPCIWTDGVRKEANFVESHWCVLDFDSGEMSLKEAENIFCDMVHVIGTTKSHQVQKGDTPACDRFRVLLAFEQPITVLRDYRYTMQAVLNRYPADQSPKDGARFFFPCKDIVSVSTDGYREAVLPAPEHFERPNLKRFEAYQKAGVIPPKARAALTNIVPPGVRNTTWYGIAKDLFRTGLDKDRVMSLIVTSPTYEGRVSPDLAREIDLCVSNGIKAAMKEDLR